MKIGITAAHYIATHGFEEGLRRIRADGYECIDYSEFVDTETPRFCCSDAEFDARIEKERGFIAGLGLEISQTHGPWRWPARDSTVEDRRERFEKMSRAIRGTALLGCRNFVIHPIMPWGRIDTDAAVTYEINLEFMSRLCQVAEKYAVTVCLENMPMRHQSLVTPEHCLRLVREVGAGNFKICLDTGHCTIHKIAPGDAVRMLGKEMLAALHVHDNDGEKDRHWYPYSGVIDWSDFGAALREIGFTGTLSLESGVIPGRESELYELARRLTRP